ncbi:hypothetical protein JHK87_000849 [Glycine soja]|nr:hypothetical protein JHK87_000849 [Glycine soja]
MPLYKAVTHGTFVGFLVISASHFHLCWLLHVPSFSTFTLHPSCPHQLLLPLFALSTKKHPVGTIDEEASSRQVFSPFVVVHMQDFFTRPSGKRTRNDLTSQYNAGGYIPQQDGAGQDGAGDAAHGVFEIEGKA